MTEARTFPRANGDDDRISADVYASLVDSLFGSFVSLAAGAAGGMLAAGLTAWKSGDPLMFVCVLLIGTVGIARVFVAYYYGRRVQNAFDLARTRRWELLYAIGACAYSASLGLWCFTGIHMNDGEIVHLICASVTIGYTAGISGRNAGRPRMVVAQIILAAGPLSLALAARQDPYYAGLAVLMAMFFFSMHGVSRSLYETLVRALVATRDVTALANRFDTALNHMPHGLCMFDAARVVLVCNDQIIRMFGLDPVVKHAHASAQEFIALCSNTVVVPRAERHRFARDVMRLLSGHATAPVELTVSAGRTILLSAQPMPNGGLLLMAEDITERRLAEAQIAHLARFDHLTDLPNRIFFRDYVEQALSRTRRRGDPFAILCIDLDRFKEVNDTLGHPIGDQLLAAVSLRLRGLVRGSDIVARFGGDEFVVLQSPIERPDQAGALAARIVDVLSEPYDLSGHRVLTGASVGVAFSPADGMDFDILLKNADMALYSAKGDGRGTFRFFEGQMDIRAQARRTLELDLRTAVANQGFLIHYQPLMDVKTREIRGCEALLRWAHPDRGFIPPSEFIPVAEEMGLIVEIGEWVLRRACTEARRWPRETRVAVNLSPVQFTRGNLIDVVKRILAETELPPRRLELEVTETALLQDTERTRETIAGLRALGIRLSLDDFGTGYSSLSYLHAYPFDKVKIDRSFLRDMQPGAQSLTVLRGVARLSAELGMSVTVEGIETPQQLAHICADMYVDEVQGYLISRPLPVKDLRKFLAEPPAHLCKVA